MGTVPQPMTVVQIPTVAASLSSGGATSGIVSTQNIYHIVVSTVAFTPGVSLIFGGPNTFSSVIKMESLPSDRVYGV